MGPTRELALGKPIMYHGRARVRSRNMGELAVLSLGELAALFLGELAALSLGELAGLSLGELVGGIYLQINSF